jgi:serine/threonine-protein kinase SRPK3
MVCRAEMLSAVLTITDRYVGAFIREDLVPCTRNWRSEMPTCMPEDADRFFNFLRMICWLPEERATAGELKNDPWFDGTI